MSPFSWGALAILVVGVMMYRFADKIQAVLSCRREPRLSPSASLPLEPESSESAEELDGLAYPTLVPLPLTLDPTPLDHPVSPTTFTNQPTNPELPHKYSSTPLPHRKQYGTHERQHRRMLPGQSREAGSSPHAPPAIISNRVGIISSEYSCAKRDPRGLLFEHTNLPIPTRSTRGAPSSRFVCFSLVKSANTTMPSCCPTRSQLPPFFNLLFLSPLSPLPHNTHMRTTVSSSDSPPLFPPSPNSMEGRHLLATSL